MAELSGTGGSGALALATGVAAADEGTRALPADLPPAAGVAEVHYHLPVEVEVRATPEPVDADEIAEQVLTALARGIANT